MRLFLTLCSIAVLAYGKPQGYNYGSGVSGTFGGLNGLGSGQSSFIAAPSVTQQQQSSSGPVSVPHSAGHSSHTGHAGNIGATFGSINSLTSSSNNNGFSGFSNVQTPSFNGFQSQATNANYQQQQQSAQFEAPLVHKQFFTISAQEDSETLDRSKHLVIGRPQKNYRVVFIKAPSSSNAYVKLSAEYAPKEEKTVIYVLTKKDSSLEVNDIATPAPEKPSKPEVFFIKYKTEQEAQHAQRQIQAEYDKIEGTSEVTDGGIAPQQSVIGILDNQGSVSSSSNNNGFASSNIVQNTASSSSTSNFANVAVPQAANSPTYLPPATL